MGKRKRQGKGRTARRSAGPVSFEVRLRIVREVLRGATHADTAVAFGVSVPAVQKYVSLYRAGGVTRCIPSSPAPRHSRSNAPRSEPRRERAIRANSTSWRCARSTPSGERVASVSRWRGCRDSACRRRRCGGSCTRSGSFRTRPRRGPRGSMDRVASSARSRISSGSRTSSRSSCAGTSACTSRRSWTITRATSCRTRSRGTRRASSSWKRWRAGSPTTARRARC